MIKILLTHSTNTKLTDGHGRTPELLLSSQCCDGFNFIDGIDVQYDRSVESP